MVASTNTAHLCHWPICAIVLSGLAAIVGCRGESANQSHAVVSPRETHSVADEDEIVKRLEKIEAANARLTEQLNGMATTAADDRKRLDELFEQGEDLQNHVAQTHRLVDQITSTQQLRYRRLVDRGTQFHAVGDYVGAIEAFSGALDADPNGYVAYINRGTAHQGLGQWHRALADYIVARNLEPENYVPWNNAAWLFATCPDERVRDADLAFDAATKACQLSDWKEAGTISTLAAAHAERGEFDAAINRINEAIKLAPEAVHGELMEQRTLFENRQPVRIGLTPSESATPDAENSESASP